MPNLGVLALFTREGGGVAWGRPYMVLANPYKYVRNDNNNNNHHHPGLHALLRIYFQHSMSSY